MKDNILDHITHTYLNLRIGMSIIGLALPLVLVIAASMSNTYSPQDSISAYYHTPMRDVFVGSLIAIGFALYLYKGYSDTENLALNLAGILVVIVALFPTDVPATLRCEVPPWLPSEPFVEPIVHKASAILFFAAIAFICIFCRTETLGLFENGEVSARYSRSYLIYGILMILLPTAAIVMSYLIGETYGIFLAESMALWVFALFWYTKSREINRLAIQAVRDEEKPPRRWF